MTEGQNEPLLVVKGAAGEDVKRARLLGCSLAVIIPIGTVIVGSCAFPALSIMRVPDYAFGIPLLILSAGGAYVAERLVRSRLGRAELYADEIAFLKERGRYDNGWFYGFGPSDVAVDEVRVRWTDVKGFDDSKTDFVKLVLKTGGSSFHTIPTLREEDRVAVLKLLDEKGVPRVE